MIKNKSGFTIVELLIVVVVIAILAAITIVSFNGIQNRAHQTTNTQGIAQYAKGAMAYAVENGTYPVPGGYGCLADIDATGKCSNVGNGVSVCFGMGVALANTALDTAMKTVLSGLPVVSSQTAMCGGQPYGGTYLTVDANGKGGLFHSFWRGNITCPSISGVSLVTRTQQEDVTLCRYSLPAL